MTSFVPIISGPTGSGKTDFALEIADSLKIKCVNVDSFQFYRELPIIGNQPLKRKEAFEFLGFRSLAEPINAGEFSRLSLSFLNSNYLWIGTGLYLGACLYGLNEDRRKGTPFQGDARVQYRMIVLNPPREELYKRLNDRVDEMLKLGALEEAEKIFESLKTGKLNPANPVLKAIGLKHLLKVLEGSWQKDEAVALWKRDTRRLAKRQWTWLRKFCPPSSSILWLSKPERDRALDHLVFRGSA